MRTLMSAIVTLVIFSVPAIAQQSRPQPSSLAEELAKENAALKAYIGKLEDRIRELQQKSKTAVVPLPLLPNPYVVPPQPRDWWLRPFTPALPPTPGQAPPPGAQRFRFNGQDVFVIPLR